MFSYKQVLLFLCYKHLQICMHLCQNICKYTSTTVMVCYNALWVLILIPMLMQSETTIPNCTILAQNYFCHSLPCIYLCNSKSCNFKLEYSLWIVLFQEHCGPVLALTKNPILFIFKLHVQTTPICQHTQYVLHVFY